jgi:O-methyltransferase
MKRLIRTGLRRLGYDFVHHLEVTDPIRDLMDAERAIIWRAKPFTMTSLERMAALVNAVNYVARNKIPGDIAECGVWRGGSMMIVALTLLLNGDKGRSLYLYDTFEGMSAPTDADKSADGVLAGDLLAQAQREEAIWCYSDIEEVRKNLVSTGYPAEKIHLIKGKVEETIPRTLPRELSILRLDTDWYESTKHELTHLYPLLRREGVLIIDDYGDWQGARKAVDEYFRSSRAFLHRIDRTGRMVIKTA